MPSSVPGCPLIALSYPEQLEHKQRALAAAFAPYSELASAPIAATVPADPGRALSVARQARHARRPHRSFRARHARAHRYSRVPGAHTGDPNGTRRATRSARVTRGRLVARSPRGRTPGVLVTLAMSESAERDARAERARAVAALDPAMVSVAVSTRALDAPQLLGGELEVLAGPSELRHRPDRAAPFHYASHGAFTQAHAGQLAKLQRAIAEAINATSASPGRERSLAASAAHESGPRVLELYAGSGALSLRLAAGGARVTSVEAFAPAVRMAETRGSRARPSRSRRSRPTPPKPSTRSFVRAHATSA